MSDQTTMEEELWRRVIQLKRELHMGFEDNLAWEVGNVIARRANVESDSHTVKERLQWEVARLEGFLLSWTCPACTVSGNFTAKCSACDEPKPPLPVTSMRPEDVQCD